MAVLCGGVAVADFLSLPVSYHARKSLTKHSPRTHQTRPLEEAEKKDTRQNGQQKSIRLAGPVLLDNGNGQWEWNGSRVLVGWCVCCHPRSNRSLSNPSSVCLLSGCGNSTKRYDHVKPRFAAVAAVPSSKHSRSCHLTPLQRESEARSFLLQLQAPTDAPRPITASNSFSTAPA